MEDRSQKSEAREKKTSVSGLRTPDIKKENMKAKSIIGKSTEEIKSALEQSMSDGFIPTLAIVFISVKQNREAICELLHKEGMQIFGSTTSGEFISSEISTGGIAIMLIDTNPAYFKVTFQETGSNTVFESAKQFGKEGMQAFDNPAFIIASGWLHTDGEEIIKGIEAGFDGEAPIFGGMAGDDLALSEPIVFTYGKSSTTGIVAIIIDQDKIDITGIVTLPPIAPSIGLPIVVRPFNRG